MKKHVLIMGAVAIMAVTSLAADDSMKVKTKAPAPAAPAKKVAAGGPVDRKVEFRLGPRVSWLTSDLRVGKTGTNFDVDNLGLSDASWGLQASTDYQPWNRWHLGSELTYDRIDQTGTTSKHIGVSVPENVGSDPTLGSGSTVFADLHIFTYEGTLGYDVIKNNTWRLTPYFGFVSAAALGTAGVHTNTATNINPKTPSGSVTAAEITYLGGVEARAYVTRDWYLGGKVGGSGMENWYLIDGDAYVGYDFSQELGLRTGYAFDYAEYENSSKSTKAQPMLGAWYMQVVFGF